jgi:hypothetical protein
MDDMEKMMQQIIEMLAKAEADGKAYQGKMAADKEDLPAKIKEDRQANQ